MSCKKQSSTPTQKAGSLVYPVSGWKKSATLKRSRCASLNQEQATLAATCKAILHHIALEAEQFQLATIHRKGCYAQPGFLLRASCIRGYRMSRCRAPYSRVRIKGCGGRCSSRGWDRSMEGPDQEPEALNLKP